MPENQSWFQLESYSQNRFGQADSVYLVYARIKNHPQDISLIMTHSQDSLILSYHAPPKISPQSNFKLIPTVFKL